MKLWLCDGGSCGCVPHEGIWCVGGRCVCVPHEGTGVMGVVVCMLRASGVMV